MNIIVVALGGALGAALRYVVGLAVAFPLGTLAVNLVGSFVIGLVFAGMMDRAGDRMMLFAMTGVLGGFTTFSAFSLDTLRLMEDGRIGAAGGYVAASVLGCLAACWAGLTLGRAFA